MKRIDLLAFFLFFFLSFLFHYPHIVAYKADTNFDFYLHYNWGKEFSESLFLGDLYPRWIYHGSFELGEPTFLIYSPLYYWLTSFFSIFTNSTWLAMQLVEIFSTIILGFFLYKTLSYYVKPAYATLAGAAVIFNPFIIMISYKFNGFPWAATGSAALGFLLWSIMRPRAERHWINLWAALAIGLAVLSHIVSALVALICFSFACLVINQKQTSRTWRVFIQSVTGWMLTVLLGLMISAIYLLPALTSMKWISPSAWAGFAFQSFSFPVYSAYKHGVNWFGFQWPISILAALTVVMPTIYYLRQKKHQNSWLPDTDHKLRLAMAIGLASIFFASELSYPLWTFENPLQMVTLPYRFISVTYVVGITLCCLNLYRASCHYDYLWKSILLATVIFSILGAITILVKSVYLDGEQLTKELHNDQYTYGAFKKRFYETGFDGKCMEDDFDCIHFSRKAAAFRGVPEYVLKTRGRDWFEYAKHGLAGECAARNLRCEELERTRKGRSWHIESEHPTRIRIPQFDFPAWQVYLAGKLVPHETDPKTGLILIELPSGEHEINVYWKRLPSEWIGFGISLLAIFIFTLIALIQRRKTRHFK